jgi:glycosyltransferase involved in cell wall biosynthesis/nucleoside-diphosphate-sugar epimerase
LVIPAYNKGEHLAEAIDSVLGQDYPRLDLVVVDDGSTDDTRAVLAGYGSRIRWYGQANAGQSAALNRGWALTGGELVGYLSADDVLLPHAVTALADALGARPDAVCAYGDYHLMDVSGRVVREVRAPEFDYRSMVARFTCPPGPGVLFTRPAAARAGWWNAGLRLVPDQDFWLRLGLVGPFVHVPATLARFRVHPTSTSFAAPSPEVVGEYVAVIEEWFAGDAVPPELRAVRAEALSSAYLMEARAHLRGQRYRSAAASAARALRLHPASVDLRTARLLAHGVVHHRRSAFRPARRPPLAGAAARPGPVGGASSASAGPASAVPASAVPAPVVAVPAVGVPVLEHGVDVGPRRADAPTSIVLTGGSGVVGTHVRAALPDRDLLLLGRTRVAAGPRERWCHADLSTGPVDLAVPAGSALCHLAVDRDDHDRDLAMALGLLAAVNADPRITRVVVVSTISVYDPRQRGVVDESARCRPRTAYGRARLAAEQPWLLALRPDCELVVLRLGSVVAAERAASYALVTDTLCRPLRAGVLGSLRRGTGVHYVGAPTVAAAVQFSLDAPLPARRTVFNVVDDQAPENLDYPAMQDAARGLACRPPQRRLPVPGPAVALAATAQGRPGGRHAISAHALRAAGFVNPVPLRRELVRIVGTVTGSGVDQPAAGVGAADAGGTTDVEAVPTCAS